MTSKFMTSTYIKNSGIEETYLNNKKKTSLEWDGEYDGNIGKLHIESNNNGQKENMNLEFDNKDLLNLLNHTEVNEPIDQRLIKDFLTSSNKHTKTNLQKKKLYQNKYKSKKNKPRRNKYTQKSRRKYYSL